MPTLEYGIFRNTNNISLNSSKKQNWLQNKHLLEMKIVLVRLNAMPKEGTDSTINYSTIRRNPRIRRSKKICFVQLYLLTLEWKFSTVQRFWLFAWTFPEDLLSILRQKLSSNLQKRAKTFMDAKDCSSRNRAVTLWNEQPNPEHLYITPEL